MWGQVSMEKALRAYLSGKTVKVVDLPNEAIRDLSEVLRALEDGTVFFAETVAVENVEFKEAVEEMVAPVRNSEQVEDDYDPHDPTASAAISGTGDGLQKAKPVEAPPKKKRGRPAKSLSKEEFLDAMARKRGEL